MGPLCGPEGFETNDCEALDLLGGYDRAAYWGGTTLGNRMFMRDLDDPGPALAKEALFGHGEPLFSDMYSAAIEEWTIHNTSKTDHPYHQDVNPFLVTHINGVPLPEPEWRDTVLVPSRVSDTVAGTVTLRMRYHPAITGVFVAHCHILTHEDVGMMQELRIRQDPTLPPR
ncbi:MAG: multicopper oxidase domain-containing protein [Planctomycetota bacterium]